MITIYHNPRCSKSREALELIERFAAQRGRQVNIVDYLNTPLTQPQLATLLRQLGCGLHDLVRSNEEEYRALGLAQADEARLLSALAENPKLLQRPIVVYGDRAVIARPLERLLTFLQID